MGWRSPNSSSSSVPFSSPLLRPFLRCGVGVVVGNVVVEVPPLPPSSLLSCFYLERVVGRAREGMVVVDAAAVGEEE